MHSVDNSFLFVSFCCVFCLCPSSWGFCLPPCPPHLAPTSHLSLPRSVGKGADESPELSDFLWSWVLERKEHLQESHVLASWGCITVNWLDQQKFNFSQIGRLQVPDQGTFKVGFIMRSPRQHWPKRLSLQCPSFPNQALVTLFHSVFHYTALWDHIITLQLNHTVV